jgi:hypothetical protein
MALDSRGFALAVGYTHYTAATNRTMALASRRG